MNSARWLCLHVALPTSLSPRPDLCEYGDACTKAHSAQELQEWIQRRRAVELRGQAAWQDGLVPYQERLLAEYQRSSSEVLVVSGPWEWVGWGPGLLLKARLPHSWQRPLMECVSPATSP